MPATSASSHAFGILGRNSVVDLGWEWSVVVNARIAPPRRHALNRMNLLSLNSGGDRRAARLAFEGRVVELLDLLPAFRAYVQMSLPYAVFGVHGIAPEKTHFPDLADAGLILPVGEVDRSARRDLTPVLKWRPTTRAPAIPEIC